jgi:hypothetical protein
VMSGVSPELGLVEMIELPVTKHPHFIGCQFHPEFKSKPMAAHPLFTRFVTPPSCGATRARRTSRRSPPPRPRPSSTERGAGRRMVATATGLSRRLQARRELARDRGLARESHSRFGPRRRGPAWLDGARI